jgi:hypothetical protein
LVRFQGGALFLKPLRMRGLNEPTTLQSWIL